MPAGRTNQIGWKVAASAAALAVFATLGLLAAVLRPFASLSAGPGGAGAGPQVAAGRAAALPELPLPPDTRLVFEMPSRAGRHRRYESRLRPEGLWLFYTQEMPRLGWVRDDAFEKARRAQLAREPVLSFKKDGARCIIGLADGRALESVVNVLVVTAPERERRQ